MGIEVNGIDLAKEYREVRSSLGTLLCHCNNIIESAEKSKKENLKTGYDDGYDCGVDEMYSAMRKIFDTPEDGGYSIDELESIFGFREPTKVLDNLDGYTIIRKAKENEGKFILGDIVARKTDEYEKYWVNGIGKNYESFSGIALISRCVPVGSSVDGLLTNDFRKTGEHRDLNCIVKAVK